MKTLITAATSAQAYQLKKNIGAADVLLGDYGQLPEFMLKSGQMIRLPHPHSTAYAHEMLTLCLDNQIGAIYALRDEEKAALASVQKLFEEYNIVIIADF